MFAGLAANYMPACWGIGETFHQDHGCSFFHIPQLCVLVLTTSFDHSGSFGVFNSLSTKHSLT